MEDAPDPPPGMNPPPDPPPGVDAPSIRDRPYPMRASSPRLLWEINLLVICRTTYLNGEEDVVTYNQ